jgi:hypothetical protein
MKKTGVESECLNKSTGIDRYKEFAQLLNLAQTCHSDIKIISVEQCQFRFTVDGYAGDEERFIDINELGLIRLLKANGEVLRTFSNQLEVNEWFIPKKDREWEQVLNKMWEN